MFTAQVGGINVHSIHHTKIKLPGNDVSNVYSAAAGRVDRVVSFNMQIDTLLAHRWILAKQVKSLSM